MKPKSSYLCFGFLLKFTSKMKDRPIYFAYEVIQDIIQLLDFLFTELNHNVESFWSLKDLLMLVENGLPKVRKRESKIG
jgi:hypothetical protein